VALQYPHCFLKCLCTSFWKWRSSHILERSSSLKILWRFSLGWCCFVEGFFIVWNLRQSSIDRLWNIVINAWWVVRFFVGVQWHVRSIRNWGTHLGSLWFFVSLSQLLYWIQLYNSPPTMSPFLMRRGMSSFMPKNPSSAARVNHGEREHHLAFFM